MNNHDLSIDINFLLEEVAHKVTIRARGNQKISFIPFIQQTNNDMTILNVASAAKVSKIGVEGNTIAEIDLVEGDGPTTTTTRIEGELEEPAVAPAQGPTWCLCAFCCCLAIVFITAGVLLAIALGDEDENVENK